VTTPKRQTGDHAEELVCALLTREGYQVRERNAACRYGEVDIIAEKDEVLCFVEVRCRSTDAQGAPALTVSWAKQRKVVRAAMAWLQRHRLFERMIRFDVAQVVGRGKDAQVELIPNAFDAGF
jgi:putative endonuclease